MSDPAQTPPTRAGLSSQMRTTLGGTAVFAIGVGLGRLTGILELGSLTAWTLHIGLAVGFGLAMRSLIRPMYAPIRQLSDAIRQIASGASEVELPTQPVSCEFAGLIGSVNELLERVEGQQQDVERANERLRAKNVELQAANEILSQLSITDGLTKLHNHRHFQDLLQREARRVSRSKEPLSLILLDLDDFKQLNDQHGHAAGDEVLAWVARVLNDHVRETDLLARYGGEEFAVLCIDTELENAVLVAEKLRMAVESMPFNLPNLLEPLAVSISAGVAEFRGDGRALFAAADRALYSAKAQGKNCVHTESDGEAPAEPVTSPGAD